MKNLFIILAVVVLIVVIVGGILAYTYLPNQNPTTTPTGETNTPPKTLITVDEIRDGAMVYLAANHTGTISMMSGVTWSGGRQDTGLVGAENYVYTSGSWSCVIDYPVVPNPTYNITLDYTASGTSIRWLGSYQNGFCEASAAITGVDSNVTAPGIRDLTMMYLRVYHNNTSPYMQGMMSWSGGQMGMGMMVGSNKYGFESNGWNVTISNPVVPNPTYTINAVYMPSGMQRAMMTWEGTLDNGVMMQTSWAYSP